MIIRRPNNGQILRPEIAILGHICFALGLSWSRDWDGLPVHGTLSIEDFDICYEFTGFTFDVKSRDLFR